MGEVELTVPVGEVLLFVIGDVYEFISSDGEALRDDVVARTVAKAEAEATLPS